MSKKIESLANSERAYTTSSQDARAAYQLISRRVRIGLPICEEEYDCKEYCSSQRCYPGCGYDRILPPWELFLQFESYQKSIRDTTPLKTVVTLKKKIRDLIVLAIKEKGQEAIIETSDSNGDRSFYRMEVAGMNVLYRYTRYLNNETWHEYKVMNQHVGEATFDAFVAFVDRYA